MYSEKEASYDGIELIGRFMFADTHCTNFKKQLADACAQIEFDKAQPADYDECK